MNATELPTDAEVIDAMLKGSMQARAIGAECREVNSEAFTNPQKENWPLLWAEYEAKAVESREGK